MSTTQNTILLPRSTNQARGLARYCRDFLTTPRPIGAATLARYRAWQEGDAPID